ncbi:hypothetical protein FRB93_009503 [Tulasnella sp. JGI-2019a]|nr:hypothetical protein FRB93_009503 [Tulasnella sp. JGI-2019a]
MDFPLPEIPSYGAMPRLPVAPHPRGRPVSYCAPSTQEGMYSGSGSFQFPTPGPPPPLVPSGSLEQTGAYSNYAVQSNQPTYAGSQQPRRASDPERLAPESFSTPTVTASATTVSVSTVTSYPAHGANPKALITAIKAEIAGERRDALIDENLLEIRQQISQPGREAHFRFIAAGGVAVLVDLLKIRSVSGKSLEVVVDMLGMLEEDSHTAHTAFQEGAGPILIGIMSKSQNPNAVALAIWALSRMSRDAQIAKELVSNRLGSLLIEKGLTGSPQPSQVASWCMGNLVYNEMLADALVNQGVVQGVSNHLCKTVESRSPETRPEDYCAAIYPVARLSRSIKIAKLFHRAGCVKPLLWCLNNSDDPDVLMWSARAVGCLMRPNSGDMAKVLLEGGAAQGLARLPRVIPKDCIRPLESFGFAIQRFGCAEWGTGTRKALIEAGILDSLMLALKTASTTAYPQAHVDLALAVSLLGDIGGGEVRERIIRADGVEILKRLAILGSPEVTRACNTAVTSLTGNLFTRNAASAKSALVHDWSGGCPDYQPISPSLTARGPSSHPMAPMPLTDQPQSPPYMFQSSPLPLSPPPQQQGYPGSDPATPYTPQIQQPTVKYGEYGNTTIETVKVGKSGVSGENVEYFNSFQTENVTVARDDGTSYRTSEATAYALTGFETITIAQGNFTNQPPHRWYNSLGYASPETECDPHIFNVGDSFTTNYTLFTWTILSVYDEAPVGFNRTNLRKSSVAYNGTNLDNCDFATIRITADPSAWVATFMGTVVCNITYFPVVLSTTWTMNLASYGPNDMSVVTPFYIDPVAYVADMLMYAGGDLFSSMKAALSATNNTGTAAMSLVLESSIRLVPLVFCHNPRLGSIDSSCTQVPPDVTELLSLNLLSTDGTINTRGNVPRFPSLGAAENALQVMLAAIRLDIGNTFPNNFMVNPDVINKTLSSTFTGQAPANFTVYSELFQNLKYLVPLEIVSSQPAVIVTQYLCHVPRAKSVGQIIISVMVATLSMFSSGWAVFIMMSAYFETRRYKQVDAYEGRINIKGNNAHESQDEPGAIPLLESHR